MSKENQNSLLLQKGIKDNSQDLQDFLKDLKNWEKDIKEVDKKLSIKSKDANKVEDIPPVRCKKKIETTSESKSDSSDEKRRKNNTEKKISGFDYAAWEKFDVEKALESSEEEEKDGGEREEDKKINRGPKASKVERATALKDEGNKLYSNGRLDDAIAKYTQGMALDPTNALLPANRAMAYIKIKKFKAAESDCNRCLKLDDKYVKGYLRRATARLNLGMTEEAMKDYKKVLELEPWNKEAKKELEAYNFPSEQKKTEMQENVNKTTQEKKTETAKTELKKHANVNKKTETKANREENEEILKPSNEKNKKLLKQGDKKIQDILKSEEDKNGIESLKPDGQKILQQDISSHEILKPQNGEGSQKKGKKLKIIEVNSKKEEMEKSAQNPNIIFPIEKPPHLRSMKPMKKIAVKEVRTRDEITKEILSNPHSKSNSEIQATPKSSEVREKEIKPVGSKSNSESSEKEKKPHCCIEKPPRTSHQFTQEWAKISKHQDIAVQYLKIIPPSFFSRLDLEPDVLVEVMSYLGGETMTTSFASKCILSLSKSTGFSVTVLFFDEAQKKVLQDLLRKCEAEEEYKSQIELLRSCLP